MPLTDAYGREVVPEALKEEQAGPTLLGLRNIFSIIDTSIGLTPEKAVGILRTAEFGDPWLYLELAERMEEKELLYQGVLHTRKMAVSQLDIDVTAAGDDDEAEGDAEFIRDVLIDGTQVDLHDVVFEMLDSLGKGYSATEIIWDTDGVSQRTGAPEWLPFDLKWRDPRWFMFDWVSGEQLLVRTLKTDGPQLPIGRDAWDSRLTPINLRVRTDVSGAQIGIQPATSPLAPFKFITHITRAKAGLPIRGGFARLAIWVYLFKNYILKDWMTFAEVYGQPMRLGKYGPGATEPDKAALLRAVANIGTDASAIIPESMAIEFVESKGGGQKSHEMYEKFCLYLDKLLTIGILGQELTTQLPHGAGSRAAAQVHDVVRRDIATDDARRVSASLNRDLVKPLIDLNRGPRHRYPQILIGFKQTEDLVDLAASMGPFVDRGMRISEKWLREKFGAPDPEEGEELLHPQERISAQSGGEAPGGGPPATSAISGAPMGPEFTDVGSSIFAGNPQAVGFKLIKKSGSKPFCAQVSVAAQALPMGAKQLLRRWTISTIEKSPDHWVGLTDPHKRTITIAEAWDTGEISTDPGQVLRHEVGHAAANEVRGDHPTWWRAWNQTVEPELRAHAAELYAAGFEYLFKRAEDGGFDEAFAEFFSNQLEHPADPIDRKYAKLRRLMPGAHELMETLIKPFGVAIAAAQKKRHSSWNRY